MHSTIHCRMVNRLLTVLVLAFLFSVPTFSQEVNQQEIKEKARSIYPKIENIEIDTNQTVPSIIRGILANNINLRNDNEVKNFLQKSSGLFKIDFSVDDFKTEKISTDQLGMTHLRLQQKYKGVPVWGSEFILHSNALNQLREISGRFVPDLNIDVAASISSERALQIALDDLGPAEYRWLNLQQEKIIKKVYNDQTHTWKPDPELMIAPMHGDFKNGGYHLVWKMTIAVDGAKLGNYEYFVDAKTGKIINKFNSMPNASGVSNYNGVVSINTYSTGSTY